MGTGNYSGEFKCDAVQQITMRKWMKLFAEPRMKPDVDHEAES